MLRDNIFEFMKLPAQHKIIDTNLMKYTLQDFTFIVLKNCWLLQYLKITFFFITLEGQCISNGGTACTDVKNPVLCASHS